MKFKKLVSVVLVAACVFSLAACGSDKKSEDKKVEVTKAEDLKDLSHEIAGAQEEVEF